MFLVLWCNQEIRFDNSAVNTTVVSKGASAGSAADSEVQAEAGTEAVAGSSYLT